MAGEGTQGDEGADADVGKRGRSRGGARKEIRSPHGAGRAQERIGKEEEVIRRRSVVRGWGEARSKIGRVWSSIDTPRALGTFHRPCPPSPGLPLSRPSPRTLP